MTHIVALGVCALALLACGGGAAPSAGGAAPNRPVTEVDDTTGGEAASAADTVPDRGDASPDTGATNDSEATGPEALTLKAGERNQVDLRKADPSSRGGGAAPSKIKPSRTEAAMRFVVVDKAKGPIRGIVISLTDPQGNAYYTGETDAEGFAEVLVPVGKAYDLVFLSLGRREISAKVPVSDEPNQNIKLTLRYNRIDAPKPKTTHLTPSAPRFVLEGVQFDSGKATLRPESFPRLDGVVEYMSHKPSATIEIAGHTDNVGNPKRNKALSKKRAEACRDYLVSKGIDGARIQAVGYGDEVPIASNDSEEGRQQNRRIEAFEL